MNEKGYTGGKLINKKNCLIIMAAAVLLLASSCTTAANHRPIITSLEAEPERVLPSGSCQIACNASDRDGDELSYNWSASGGNITGTGPEVTWTAPDSVGPYRVTVTVTDGRGGKFTNHVTITVRASMPPKISSLIADAVWITPSGSIQVTCDAEDPDDDELSYEWTATGGDITGTGAVVNWTAPQEVGMYDITVVVDDGHDREDTMSVTIIVATGTPPMIENLVVTAEHKYLKTTTTGYKVGKGKEYYIKCIASGTSELVYEWSCDGGEISGEGSMITWTAPNTSGDVTVTVKVFDGVGNWVKKSIVLEVVSCSSCEFG